MEQKVGRGASRSVSHARRAELGGYQITHPLPVVLYSAIFFCVFTDEQLAQLRNVIREEVEPVKKDLKTLKRSVRKIEKTVDILIRRTDEEDVALRRRVERIEDHLGLPEPH